MENTQNYCIKGCKLNIAVGSESKSKINGLLEGVKLVHTAGGKRKECRR
jgi:hypothetical protein